MNFQTKESIELSNLVHSYNSRPAITHTFTLGSVQCYLNVGLNPDGSPWEVFITISKEGSTMAGFADSFARLLSTAIQYNVPLDVLCRRMIGQRFEPNGVAISSEISEADSIIDYIFKWLKQRFIDQCPKLTTLDLSNVS